MSLLITNIKELVNTRAISVPLRGKSLAELPSIANAWLFVKEGLIQDFGPMIEPFKGAFDSEYNAGGAMVLPCWCDSHTHAVFAGSREGEFVDKIKGLTYSQIAERGGGILSTARTVRESSEDELFQTSLVRVQDLIRLGTGAIEIKSGYGLTLESELKMLRVIRRLGEALPIPVKSTFLGAHSFPPEFREDRDGYIRLIIKEMIPAIEKENLADYIDVFCEENFFSPEETIRICEAGMRAGMKARLHANQLNVSGGVEAGVKLGALSVDHLESMDSAAIQTLASSKTIGTLLPTAAFFLRMPFQPARELIENDCAVALASDFNPGSSPSGNMNLVIAMACIGMRMLPQEAINAATTNGALAMELGEEVGSIDKGKIANLIFTKPISSIAYLPYSFGSNLIDRVMINGKWIS